MQQPRWIAGLAAALILAPLAQAAAPENGRFHHVHLNVGDVARTQAFYGKVFGTVPLDYAGRQPAMRTDLAFIFLNPAKGPIRSANLTAVNHIGWSGVDGPTEFAGLKAQGIEFYTALTPFLGGHFMYLYGPDREVVEIWTAIKGHRFNHVHLLSPDPKATAQWYAKVTNSAAPAAGPGTPGAIWNVPFGDVALHVLPDIPIYRPRERTGPIEPTDGAGIDHLAFSFADLAAAHRRVRALGIAIERPLKTDPATGLASFFVRGPQGVLVEFIEANPLPEAAWR